MKKKINLNSEMGKMLKHHEELKVHAKKILADYKGREECKSVYEFRDGDEIRTIVELLDIGYLDSRAYRVVQEFGSIVKVVYNGGFPFTESGMTFIRSRG